MTQSFGKIFCNQQNITFTFDKNKFMGIQYGKGLAREALRLLSSPADPITRLLKGWSEIEVAHSDDAHHDEYIRIKEWKEKYLNSTLPKAKNWNEVSEDENVIIECRQLSEELVSICCDMLERVGRK